MVQPVPDRQQGEGDAGNVVGLGGTPGNALIGARPQALPRGCLGGDWTSLLMVMEPSVLEKTFELLLCPQYHPVTTQ